MKDEKTTDNEELEIHTIVSVEKILNELHDFIEQHDISQEYGITTKTFKKGGITITVKINHDLILDDYIKNGMVG